MVFSSLEFIYLFMPPVLVGFMVLRALRLETAIIWWLTAASLAFYAWWSPPHLLLLMGSVIVNYGLHLHLLRRPSKAAFVTGVTINMALLAVFKYADFMIGNVNAATGLDISKLGLVLPLAISFYTFQQISFLHDTWSGKLVRQDFVRYLLFVTFFPQLIAGPIVMQRDTVPQFKLARFTGRVAINTMLGLTLFLIGLFKKIVLADGVSPIANAVFNAADAGTAISTTDAWVGSLAYTFQIYFDFSGYCDMAIGLALLFGIRLPVNFNSPYRSLSIVEFWRRWHITLSRFLRDYLYIPLGGNRSGMFGRQGNLMITMLLGGLWHGAGWNFVIWGGLHGGYLIANHIWSASAVRKGLVSFVPKPAYALAAWIVTMLAVVVAWVFFRATTLDGALAVLGSMAGVIDPTNLPTAITGIANSQTLLLLVGLTGIVTLFPNSIELTRRYRPVLQVAREIANPHVLFSRLIWFPSRRWGIFAAVAGAAAIIQIYRLNGLTEFIYFNF